MNDQSLENDFYNWLSGQVSTIQLSNMYSAFAGIDEFCISRKILERPLFQTTDKSVLVRVRDTVERNQVFGFIYKKQCTLMSQAIRLYIVYIDQMAPAVTEDKLVTLDDVSSSQQDVTDSLVELLVEDKIPFVDFRSKGGCLWMLGGSERSSFVNRCKDLGVNFYLKNDGSRATNGKPAWWTKDMISKTETPPSAPKIDQDLHMFLVDDLYGPLRETLIKRGITTVQGLEEIKLWPFMNRFNLYSIATRQLVFSRVQQMLQSSDTDEKKTKYIISFKSNEFTGASPAEAFLHFCEEIAGRYPLKFRTLIGTAISSTGPVVIHKQDNQGECLRMSNPIVYILSTMTKQLVLESASWVCKKCMGTTSELILTESTPEPVEDSPAKDPVEGNMLEPVIIPPYVEALPDTEPDIKVPEPEKLPEPTRWQLLKIDKMEQLALDADLEGVTMDELKDALGTTMVATKELLLLANHLMDIKGRVYHEEAFIDWDEGAEALDLILDKLMQKNSGYVSAAQLYEYARVDMRMFLNDNDMNDERSVYDIAQHLFEYRQYNSKYYVFTGKMHISKPTVAIINNFDIFCKYADDQGGLFTYSGLVDYLSGIGVKFGNLHAQLRLQTQPHFFYYAEGVLMSASKMHIDDAWKVLVENALKKLFTDVGDHIILREIQDLWFDQLPSLPNGLKWTPLLLQGVLRFFGKKFNARTIIAMDKQSIDTLHAMLVQLDSPIQNFGDAVVSYFVENGISQRTFEAEELRAVLVKSKMIQGNELIYNMPKALGNDERFSWDVNKSHVTILV